MPSLFFLCALFATVVRAGADEGSPVLELTRPDAKKDRIAELEYSLVPAKPIEQPNGTWSAWLRIESSEEGLAPSVNSQPALLEPAGKPGRRGYLIAVPLEGRSTTVAIASFNPKARIRRDERIELRIEGAETIARPGSLPGYARAPHMAELKLEPEVAGETLISGNRARTWVTLKGAFGQRDSSLTLAGRQVQVDGGGRFRVHVPILHDEASIEFLAVHAKGTVTREIVRIMLEPLAPPQERRHAFSVALGMTYGGYTETLSPAFSELGVVGKAGYAYSFGRSRWVAATNGYLTLVPLSVSLAGQGGVRFLGLNARLGRLFSIAAGRVGVTVSGGWYYTTMLTDGTVGFTNMMGPQLYPAFRFRLDSRNSIDSYFKYSPIVSGSSVTFSSREVAMGIAWTAADASGRTRSIALDIANLGVVIQDLIFIRSTSASLSYGLGF